MTFNSSAEPRVHLRAAALLLVLLAGLVLGATGLALRYERQALDAVTPLLAQGKETQEDYGIGLVEVVKNQGVALQRRAYERPDLLPLYGSSELLKRIPDKATVFFRNFPSGFAVFPVGKPGTTSLIMLQKIAALGEAVRGQRVAISLSPSWFMARSLPEGQYAGNFSRQQALAALLNPALSRASRHMLARRMEQHPETLKSDALLHFLASHLAERSWTDRLLAASAIPLAHLQSGIYTAQDHFEAAFELWSHRRLLRHPPSHAPAKLDWDELIANASALPVPTAEAATRFPPERRTIKNDFHFRARIGHTQEWHNFELLLRGLHELGVKPLILCMPPNGLYFEHGGVSRESLALFAERVKAMAERRGASVEVFEDHQEDRNFLVDHHDHMSAKGWMYFNRALDEFYHAPDSTLLAQARRAPHEPRRRTFFDERILRHHRT